MFSWACRSSRLSSPCHRLAALSSENIGLCFSWSLQRKIVHQNRVIMKSTKGEDGITRSDGRILNCIVPLKKMRTSLGRQRCNGGLYNRIVRERASLPSGPSPDSGCACEIFVRDIFCLQLVSWACRISRLSPPCHQPAALSSENVGFFMNMPGSASHF